MKFLNGLKKMLIFVFCVLFFVYALFCIEYMMCNDLNFTHTPILNEELYEHMFADYLEGLNVSEVSYQNGSRKEMMLQIEGYPMLTNNYSLSARNIRYAIASGNSRKFLVSSFYREVESINLGKYFYADVEKLLNEYFDDEEAIVQFTMGTNQYGDKNEPSLVNIQYVNQFRKNTNGKTLYFRVGVMLGLDSVHSTEQVAKDLTHMFMDYFASYENNIIVMVGKTEDIHFYENQNLHLIFSSIEDNLTEKSGYTSSLSENGGN